MTRWRTKVPALLVAPRTIRWLGLLALAGYSLFLALYFVPVAGGSDSSGYLNSARLLAQGRLATELRLVSAFGSDPWHFTPLGFVPHHANETAQLDPTYPTGMPLQIAAASLLGGWTLGPGVVCVGGAVAAVMLCYLWARRLGVEPIAAAVGAAALGLCPVFVFIAIQPLSDVLATTWILAATYAAMRAGQSTRWALFAGAACGLAVLVRPTNLLIIPAMLCFISTWRGLFQAFVGGLPFALWLGYYQDQLYGSPMQSGYGDIGNLFRLVNAWPTGLHYGLWMPKLLPLPFLLLGLVALIGSRKENRRLLAGLVLWGAAPFAFYAFYDVTRENWWCLRFVLPAFPALIVTALFGLKMILQRVPLSWRPAASAAVITVLGGWTIGSAVHGIRTLDALSPSYSEQGYADACRWVREKLPENALLACMVASGSAYYYTDLPILRWDMQTPDQFNTLVSRLRQTRHPFYALFHTLEQEEAFKKHSPGNWEAIEQIGDWNVLKWNYDAG